MISSKSMDNMENSQLSLRGAAIPIALNLALFVAVLAAILGPRSV